MADGGHEATGGEEAAVDRLYALDPSEFVAARDALARELRQAGRRQLATEVRRLRRPTLAAWAVDQLAHRQPERVAELLDAGERLRRVQEEVLAGGDRAALQRASDERRHLITALTGEALKLLRERGSEEPETHRGDVEATLTAAALDPEVAELLRRGRVARASPRPAGFAGLLELSLPATADSASAPVGPEAEQAPPAQPSDKVELERAREEVARLEQRAARTESEAGEARREAERAAAQVERLEAELAHARREAAEATEAAARKEAEAEAARRDADRATARLRR